MLDQYYGHKDLYEVVLRAKTPMQFGERKIEAGEPVLYFEDVKISVLSEQSKQIMARGGWGNLPHVVWDDRSEVQFILNEGVMSNVGMGILLGAKVLSNDDKSIYLSKREGPFEIVDLNVNNQILHGFYIEQLPYIDKEHKAFIFEFDRKAIQKKVMGNLYVRDTEVGKQYFVYLEDSADLEQQYLIDYYYEYKDEALHYVLQQERFNGLFSLEGKFYSKDENEGKNYTNVLYMPKVRVASNINLRLGERADPTVSTFNIIGLPETVGDYKNLIVEFTRLGEDVR